MITENDSVTTKDVHQGPDENMVRSGVITTDVHTKNEND